MKLALLIMFVLASSTLSATTIVVVKGGTVARAFANARTGDTIRIAAGVHYETDLVIHTPCTVIGAPGAVIDAQKRGSSVISVRADDVVIRGLTIRNVAVAYTEDNAAIKVFERRHVRIERCTVENGYFGVYLSKSEYCTIANNVLRSTGREESSTGNGVHLWNCRNILIEGNDMRGFRDGIYFEFVHHGTVLNNHSEANNRYGLHFMFSDSCSYKRNEFVNNGSGVAVMFTHEVYMEDNLFQDNWGDAAYGILLKEISRGHMVNCRFVRNSIAIHAEGATNILIEGCEFRNNGYAMRMMGNCIGNTIRNCVFDGNTFDVTTNSTTSLNTFNRNFWSAYEGYDLDKDGIGDVPHHPVRLYSMLVEQIPSSVMLMHSLFISILDVAEQVMPSVTPETFVDVSPRMRPPRTRP
ncbi:right-handed parallel beta-helix repeat-containing protein [soil metagenome]